ncbi:hypothetical protein C8034_v006580 [Colletotrichum sidae]|uniref:Fungal N-terminal domain-containing protein n=1 Tax=Colletotrichum sidae TaxID=1347389 RepID=A0A4R8T4U8_9PEZI|nr:hypothetical protein C8034_v006580 [Colletotrichum sidae]
MAEPVGVTGTAAGLVSLGLQLYGEISKYIDAVKGRKRDLANASRHAETLRMCLTAIDDVVSSNNNSKAAEDAVDSCMLSCKDEVKELEALITRLRGPIPTTPDTFSAKIKEKGRQLSYPFHRESVLMLERRLDSTNGVLRTALHSLELNVSIKTRDTVVRLQSDLAAIEGASQARDARLTGFGTSINTIESSSSRVENLVTGVHEQTTTISLMAAEHSNSLTRTTQVVNRLDVTMEETGRKLDRVEELLMQLSRGSRDTNRQVGQLVACPSDLQDLCDGVFSLPLPDLDSSSGTDTRAIRPRSLISSTRGCLCSKRKRMQQSTKSFGPLFFESEMSETRHHAPNCPWSRVAPPVQQHKKGFGVTIPAVHRILRRAIRASLCMSTGAGEL